MLFYFSFLLTVVFLPVDGSLLVVPHNLVIYLGILEGSTEAADLAKI